MTSKSHIILILLIGFNISLFSQKDEINFDKEINSLNQIGGQLIGAKDDEQKLDWSTKFKKELSELINRNGSFKYNFDSLKTISILQASDLKIYNWAVPFADGTYQYFAFLQIHTEKETYKIVELQDKSDEITNPETKVLTEKNWYGALYYKLIHSKKLGKEYYTVLGWDGNNNLTNKKLIDVIVIGNNGMIKFGSPIFKTKKKTKKRIIFEYSENVVMSLKYHPKVEKIVFDFLVPASSKLEGVYEYYGPALNRFDALSMSKGKWIYEEDIDIELDRTIKDMMWKNPKDNK